MSSVRFPRPHSRTISNIENQDELFRWANDIDQKIIEILYSLNQTIERANLLTTKSTPVGVGFHAPQHRAETGQDRLQTTFHTGTIAAGLGTPYGSTATTGSEDSYFRADGRLVFPKSLMSYDDISATTGITTGDNSTVTLTSNGTNQALTGDTGVLTISPATFLAVDAKTTITETGTYDCLVLVQGAGEGVHMLLDDKGGNPTEPVAAGSMWRFGNTWKIRAQTFQFGQDDGTSTTRSIQFVNNMGGAIKAHTLKWFDNTYKNDWNNNAKTHYLPDGDSSTTMINQTIGSPSVNKPEGGIIYDGLDGLHVQTLAFKRFIDAGIFFRNDSNRDRGFRFQTEDIPDPTPPDTIDDQHCVVNIPGNCFKNTDPAPSESNMMLSNVYNDLAESAVPGNPAATFRRMFVSDVTGELSVKTSAGVVVSLESGGGGGGDSFLEWAM